MFRCQHCEEEVEEGQGFCPHCGQPATATGAAAVEHQARGSATALQTVPRERREADTDANADNTVRPSPMPAFGKSRDDGDNSRRVIYIAVALASAVLVAGVVWLASRPKAQTATEQLAGAIRPGTPEFDGLRDRLVVDFDPDENAFKSDRALGDIQIDMRPIIRNFTGRTISGLEFHAAGFDLDKRVIRERIAVMPVQLDTNKVSTPNVSLVFPKDNQPTSLKLELTGITFK